MAWSMEHLYAPRALKVQASAIREICKLIARPEIRSLAGGWPDPLTFPVEEIRDITVEILRTRPELALQYTSSEGLPQLREFLAQWIGRRDGVSCTAEHILITHGSAQGMELAAKVFIEPGDVAFVGLPSYFGGSGALKTFEAEVVGVPEDGDGMQPERLQEKIVAVRAQGKRPKLVYVIPDFQNPAGTTMPKERRKRLVELSVQHDLVIVEDNPYRDLRYSGESIPPIKAFDTAERVIYLRSFSKIFCPGLRLGFAVGHRDIIRRMVIARQFEDCCANALGQHILYEFCRRGLLDVQIEKNCVHYKKKRDVMLDSLDQHFPPQVHWNRPEGGFFVFVTLPASLDGEVLLQKAVERNVAFVAGAPFFEDGSGRNTLRLSFAQSELHDLEEAVAELGSILKACIGV